MDTLLSVGKARYRAGRLAPARVWLVAATASALLACAAQAVDFSDNFDASTPSTFWFSFATGTGPSVAQAGGQVQVTVPSGSTGSATATTGFQSRCLISGDFDLDVDYANLGPTGPNSGVLDLFAWDGATFAPLGGVARQLNGDNYVVFQSFCSPLEKATTDAAGAMRIQRTGAMLHGYYDTGGTWTEIGSIAFPTQAVRVGVLGSTTPITGQVQGAFDNFSLHADGITCPSLNELCGDGTVQTPGEQCDDGNAAGGDGCCDCRTGSLSAPDVAGSWQQNVGCAGALTVVRAVSLTQTAGSSAATLTPSGCGTFFSDGEIHQISNCSASPRPAQVCGTTFAYYPPEGTVDVDPFSSAFGTCSNVSRVSARERIRGTITTDGANKATYIAGLQGFDYLRMYDQGQTAQPCYETVGTLCGFEMRRNSAPPGMNTTVEPLPGVTITFLRTDSETAVKVVPESAPSASLPPNFQVVGDTSGTLYFSIEPLFGSYAGGPGAITVCLSYTDSTTPGIVDGTNPPVNENSLKILHDEGGFVDATSSLDTVNNKVCAAVHSFSQFLLGAGAAPASSALCGATPRLDCRKPTQPGAASVLIKRSKSGKSTLTWNWRGAATTKADFGDPLTTADYQLCVYDRSAGTLIPAITTTAPAGGSCGKTTCWAEKNTRFKYKNKDATPDGLFLLNLKEGVEGKAKITLKGKGPALHVSLPMEQDPNLTVQLVNSAGLCWDADFSAATKNDTKQFKAKSD
jgi:cysteine-rich repeat protein